MPETDVVIVGGGQAGLALSRSLSLRGIDHVVLERRRIGERWQSERWRSLRLLTTNAMSALPGLPHEESDPDAFMPAAAFAAYLQHYAQRMGAPVMSGVEVTKAEPAARGFRLATNAGEWCSRAVVVATGACDTPYRPPAAGALASSILQVSPSDYWEPDELPQGGVLVIGASSSGAQLAEEIHASGRSVLLAVGDHTRVPRRYRGRDIYAWMETAGILDDPANDSANLDAARRQPSLQLVGRPDNRDLDLGILMVPGVRLVGRLAAIDGANAEFAGDLEHTTKISHVRMLRVLDRIDRCIVDHGLEAPAADPAARIPFLAAADPVRLDLQRAGVRTVVWSTGYVRRYPWLKVPVLDSRGEIIHRGGVTAFPGLYALGLTFLRRRRSSFIDGCGLDAEDLAPLIEAHLSERAREAA
ncbi:flavin-containing monooxygenase [Methylobacterium nigriterrae]|uniref:flavin-containing monooxygenase n=1 Tax=Methylobacterium nigriterrae TaxID=3127512 RepID=UPI003013E8DB